MASESILVLLVEDDEDDFVITRGLLSESEDQALALERVTTLAAAGQRLARGGIDVVLADLGLPDAQGTETYQHLIRLAPTTPIVLLTGMADEVLALAATREGVQDYLVKGRVSGRQLARSLRHAIERHRSEDEVRASAARLRQIIDEDVDATVVLDDENRVLFANRATESLFGKPPAGLLGSVFEWTIEPGVTQRQTVHQAWRGRDATVEMHAIRTQWGEVVARILRLRDITDRASAEMALKLYRENLETLVQRRTEELRRVNTELEREVNERKMAEARSEHSRRYLETIISTSHDGIAVLSEEGRFEFYNGATLRIFGWDALAVQGRSFLECVAPDQRETVRQRWAETRGAEGMVYETDVIRQDGERRSLLVSHQEMRVSGARKYCLGIMDITERKTTERKLQGALHAVEENYRAKTQFVFNVSHELKTPLASLQFAIGNMLSGIVGAVSERAVAYLEMM
jgi:PAS domain S-box-containing protein